MAKAKGNFKVKATALNGFENAGPQFKLVAGFSQGNVVQVVEEKDGWAKLEGGAWVPLEHLEKVAEETKTPAA
jgi:hypothetical protein